MNRKCVSKALREVWSWKDAGYREVAHLPRRAALKKRMENAERGASALRLRLEPLDGPRPALVAEAPAEYGQGKKINR